MNEHTKKQGFLGRTSRVFTRADRDAYNAFHFQEPEQTGDETWPALEAPDTWSPEAAGVLAAESLYRAVPVRIRAIEENTIPSWLWRRAPQGIARTGETGASQIFDRVAGAATYAGWKNGFFADEFEARAFYDETRAMLMHHAIAIDPRLLATLGVDWAYGFDDENSSRTKGEGTTRFVDISNTVIDAIVRGVADKNLRAGWRKLWPARGASAAVTLRLSDIAEDWGTNFTPGARASVDLMAFRHTQGSLNIEKLRHAVRLLVILLDLHDTALGSRIEIGVSNLAPLLMALGLAYDSDAGRATASAINAIVTAEAYATSAELAGLRGPSADYLANREVILRALRNHRRAAYGDRSDYEKISVLPTPLLLEQCPDLALVAVAQRRWEDALLFARQYGLRHTQVTSLTSSQNLAMFMESAAQGIEPVKSLMLTRPAEGDLFRKQINPAIAEGLARLGYDQAAVRGIIRHIAGAGTLDKAPGVNHTALRSRGFDEAALGRVEDYLPNASDIRTAVTPWIIGEEFARKALKVSAAKLRDPAFDLLHYLGFSAADIAAANTFCYGYGSAKNAKNLRAAHAAVFARADEISPEAHILMAAAVQSFVSGDTGLTLSLSADTPAERNEFLLLAAWRQGVKSVTMLYDDMPAPQKSKATVKRARKSAGKMRTSEFLHTKSPPPLPVRGARLKSKAGSSMVSMGRGKGKSSPSVRGKR